MRPNENANSAQIELVCFDLGGVLVRLCNSSTAAFEAAGIPVPEKLDDPAVSAAISDLGMEATVGRIGGDLLLERSARLVGLTTDEATRISIAWLAGPYVGVQALIERIAATPVRTACLSNTHDHHWRLLNEPGDPTYGWLARLDYRFASHLIGRAKPDPAIYRHVEHETGTARGQILYFDDTAEHCEAAKELGWRAHQIEPANDPVSQMDRALTHCGVF